MQHSTFPPMSSETRLPWVRRADSDGVDDGTVVFWTDICLLGALGVFALLAVPRTAGRFSRRSEWWKGHIFRSVSNMSDTDSNASSSMRRTNLLSEKPHATFTPPVHVRALPTRFFKAGTILRSDVIPGIHLGRSLIILLYFAVLLFAALFRDNVFKHSVREGVLVASQLPWVYVLATKNNAIGTLLGYGYEKLNVFHRWAGTLVVLAANVHAIGFIYQWVLRGIWRERISETNYSWGLVALVSIDILFISSLSFVRQNFYNVFYFSHLIALVLLLVAVPLHQSFAIPYVAIAAGFYGADRILRIFKSRVTTAYLQTIPDLGTTLIVIPSLNAGWRAGQHVRLRVLTTGLWWETHPYTIASACEGQQIASIGSGSADGMALMVKADGGWSKKIYELGSDRPNEPNAREMESRIMGKGVRVKVLVDGPYGGPGNTMYHTFSGVLLTAGGSGISFVLAVAQELLQRAISSPGSTNTRTIEIIWSINHARALTPLIPLFTSLLSTARAMSENTLYTTTLRIQVYYTRAVLPEDDHHYAQNLSKNVLPEGLSLSAGRVSIPFVLSDFIDRTTSCIKGGKVQGHGVAIGVCGPVSLGRDMRSAMARIGKESRRDIGGVEFYEEAFHW
ncbi:incomplete iron reductase [Trametopsis cervina]|nr:incomplete iron reductase [Trametopsis cervina]